MSKTWVVVADSSRARIFSADTPSSELMEVETLAHPEGRLHEKEITSDLPGRQNNANSNGRHAIDAETSTKKQEAIDFAKILSKRLESGRTKKNFKQLIIVAAPSFLGVLRDQLNNNTSRLCTMELDKNLTQHKVGDIRKHLPNYLPTLSL